MDFWFEGFYSEPDRSTYGRRGDPTRYHVNYLTDGKEAFLLLPEAEPRGTKKTWDFEAFRGAAEGPYNYRTHNWRLWTEAGEPTDYKLDFYHETNEIPPEDYHLHGKGPYAKDHHPDTQNWWRKWAYREMHGVDYDPKYEDEDKYGTGHGLFPPHGSGYVYVPTFLSGLSRGQFKDHLVDRDRHVYAIRKDTNPKPLPEVWNQDGSLNPFARVEDMPYLFTKHEHMPYKTPRPEARNPVMNAALPVDTTPRARAFTNAETKIAARVGSAAQTKSSTPKAKDEL